MTNLSNLLTGDFGPESETHGKVIRSIEYRDALNIPVYLHGYFTTERAESSYGQPVFVVTGGPQDMPYPVGAALGSTDIAAIGGTLVEPADDAGPVVGHW